MRNWKYKETSPTLCWRRLSESPQCSKRLVWDCPMPLILNPAVRTEVTNAWDRICPTRVPGWRHESEICGSNELLLIPAMLCGVVFSNFERCHTSKAKDNGFTALCKCFPEAGNHFLAARVLVAPSSLWSECWPGGYHISVSRWLHGN